MGAAAGCPTVVCLTLGTGGRWRVVVDGRLRFGPHGRAGELGHQVIAVGGPPCGCGNQGCVAAAAGGEGLFGPLRAAVAASAPLVDPAAYEIVPAALDPAAGAIGAALWATERAGA